VLALLGVGLTWAGTGCTHEGLEPLHPVAGKVTFDDRPLTTGAVSFRPDPSQGNKSQHIPTGVIDSEGNYRLTTGNRAGAPPGWYKVMVIAQDMGVAGASKPGTPAKAKSLVPERYLRADKTPLHIEVTDGASPGAYDLRLRK
jgi:hypothetical protein